MNVEKISNLPALDTYSLHKILTSNKLSDYEKMMFVKNNRTQIHHIMEVKLSNSEFLDMMQSRPLVRFRPLKNSYTKWGDKVILAKSLGILPSQLNDYIKNVTNAMQNINQMGKLPTNKIDSIKTYVFRHGTQEQVVTFLDYELKNSKNILKTLHSTLEYGNGGMADYFVRPIHRMKNQTLVDLYNVIDANLLSAQKNGTINNIQKEKASEWALAQILNIQYNSKLSTAIKKKSF